MSKSTFPRPLAFSFMHYNERGFIQVAFTLANLDVWIRFCMQGLTQARCNRTVDPGVRHLLIEAWAERLTEATQQRERFIKSSKNRGEPV